MVVQDGEEKLAINPEHRHLESRSYISAICLYYSKKIKWSYCFFGISGYYKLLKSATLLVTSWFYLNTYVRPTGVYLLDFFCFGIQFYLLLSPYLCFISLLYLDLYVLRDDASIS